MYKTYGSCKESVYNETVKNEKEYRRRKNQRMTQVKMFIHF